jgi:hypothetical protein
MNDVIIVVKCQSLLPELEAIELQTLNMLSMLSPGKPAVATRPIPARAMMLGGMWDSDVQDEWLAASCH